MSEREDRLKKQLAHEAKVAGIMESGGSVNGLKFVDKPCQECDGTGKVTHYAWTEEAKARQAKHEASVCGRLDNQVSLGRPPTLIVLSSKDMAEYVAALVEHHQEELRAGIKGTRPPAMPLRYRNVPVEVFDPEMQYGPRDLLLTPA